MASDSGLKALLAARKIKADGTATESAGPAAKLAGPKPEPVVVEALPESPVAKAPGKLNFLKSAKTPQPAVETKLSLDSLAATVGDEDDDDDNLLDLATVSGFIDEIPATAIPERTVPTDADKGMIQFVQTMDSIYGVLNDPELLGSVIRNIMVELKANPQYAKMIAPDDVRTWVRAMRNTMGLAKIKKQEKSKKTGTAKSKGSKALDADMEQAFADLGINMDDL
jgi:hypothetical protein